MKAKLTDTGVRSYQPRAAQYSIGDAACPGSASGSSSKGIKTFAFAYRNKGTGRVTWLTLGRYPDVRRARARELANEARKTAALGGTPLTPKVQRAEAEKTKTYAEVDEPERFEVSQDAATALRLILTTAARPGWRLACPAQNFATCAGQAHTVRTGRYRPSG